MNRAAVFHEPGRPFEQVRFATFEPQNAEILIGVTFCTLCRSDLHTHTGRRTEPTPSVLGHEMVGVVVAFGPMAPQIDYCGQIIRVGDRVTWAVAVGCGTCYFCADDLPQKCEQPFKYGHVRVEMERPITGGLSELVLLKPGSAFFRIPDEISDQVAALANCAMATVSAVVRCAGPLMGRSVVLLGAGVLGVSACAMVRAAGAKSILASDPALDCRTRATKFGATRAISNNQTELAATVLDETEGRGADVIMELAGAAESVASALSLARIGGKVLLAGSVAPVGPVAFDPEACVRRLLTIRGVHNYHPNDLAAALTFLAGAGREAPFATLVAEEFSLDQVEDAFALAHRSPGVRIGIRHSNSPANLQANKSFGERTTEQKGS